MIDWDCDNVNPCALDYHYRLRCVNTCRVVPSLITSLFVDVALSSLSMLFSGSDIRMLASIGISVKKDTTSFLMHHKFAVLDNALILNGSFNWTRAASDGNQENVMVSNNQAFVKQFAAQFEKLWSQSEQVAVNGQWKTS